MIILKKPVVFIIAVFITIILISGSLSSGLKAQSVESLSSEVEPVQDEVPCQGWRLVPQPQITQPVAKTAPLLPENHFEGYIKQPYNNPNLIQEQQKMKLEEEKIKALKEQTAAMNARNWNNYYDNYWINRYPYREYNLFSPHWSPTWNKPHRVY